MTEIELKYYHLACSFFAKNAKDESKEIDWEQRRYEIAKDALSSRLVSHPYTHPPHLLAEWAIEYADALIEELKKT